MEDVAAWRTRPLEAVYPIVYFDAMMVRVREDRSVQNRACYLALGVNCDGEREVLYLALIKADAKWQRNRAFPG